MSWEGFKELRYQDPALGIALDISRIPFPDGYLGSMEASRQKAFAEMAKLEAGKKAASGVIALQGRLLAAIKGAPGKSLTAEALAAKVGGTPRPRSRSSSTSAPTARRERAPASPGTSPPTAHEQRRLATRPGVA